MNAVVRRPFWWALAASLMLHLIALMAPGWRLPWLEQESSPLPLAATLVIPPRPARSQTPVLVPRVPQQRTETKPVAVAPIEPPRVAAAPTPESILPPPATTLASTSTGADALPAAVSPAPTFASTWPTSGRIRFTVTRGESGFIIGQAEHNWRHDGATFALRAVTETVGLAAIFKPARVMQESLGTIVATGLQPLEFKHELNGQLKQSVRIDSAQKRIFSGNGGNHELVDQTQDLLSLFYQFGALPLDLPEYSLSVATGRKVERYVVTVGETQKLDTPFGVRSVLHLKLPGTSSDESTEIWLDTQTRLPLKIRHRDRKGEVFDQTATAVDLEHIE
jgi:hypothetical protein